MAPPQAKKTKTSTNSASVFTASGLKPEICFYVFNKVFHVHSLALKMNSAFFRKFLEPAQGKPPSSSSPLFTSEWFTKVDDDDDKAWALSSNTEDLLAEFGIQFRDLPTFGFKGNLALQERAFEKFLCTIFNRSYQITDATELQVMTQMADYYGALQAMSMSVYSSFYRSPEFIVNLSKEPCILLEVAYKLRHEELFRESFIYVFGPWTPPRYWALTEPKLFKLAEAAHANMNTKPQELQREFMKYFAKYSQDKTNRHLLADMAIGRLNQHGDFLFPFYYRGCYDTVISNLYNARGIKIALEALLRNNLILDKSGKKAGEGNFKDFFLCFEAQTLPWDQTETDW